MKRCLLAIALLIALSTPILPQEHGGTASASTAHGAEEHGDPMLPWKWVNFAILAGLLGWLIGKHAPAYFSGRTSEIQKGLAEAAAMKKQSDDRVTTIEARLKNLENDIATIRSQAADEMASEEQRLRDEATGLMRKIGQHAESEIEAASNQAQNELRSYAAGLALEIAEQRLRKQVNPDVDSSLVRGFVKGMNN